MSWNILLSTYPFDPYDNAIVLTLHRDSSHHHDSAHPKFEKNDHKNQMENKTFVRKNRFLFVRYIYNNQRDHIFEKDGKKENEKKIYAQEENEIIFQCDNGSINDTIINDKKEYKNNGKDDCKKIQRDFVKDICRIDIIN